MLHTSWLDFSFFFFFIALTVCSYLTRIHMSDCANANGNSIWFMISQWQFAGDILKEWLGKM